MSPTPRERRRRILISVILAGVAPPGGHVYMGRAISYKQRGHLGKHAPRPVPKGLDWDAWTGPAEPMEFSNFRHRRWHWQWNTGSGEMGVQAIHQLDMLRWGMKLDRQPE